MTPRRETPPAVHRAPDPAADPAAAPVAVPPVIDPDVFERFEGFRETTLAIFTDPAMNAALRKVADMLYTMALEYSQHWPREPEGVFRHQARAGVADLRHLQGFFVYMKKAREASALTPAEERISRLCGRLVARVREIADTLEQALDAVRDEG